MEEPLVSIIMGTYNPKISLFKSAITSLQNQTFENWELLLIDDGSVRSIYNEIRNILTDEPRACCIRIKQNQGLAHALNCGIRMARGKYIARMDDDDFSLPTRLEEQVNYLNRNLEYGWVGCEADLFDNNGIWGKANRPEKPNKKSFLHSSPFIHPSVMFRKELLLNIGGYSENIYASRCEDYELFMRLYAKGYKGYNIKKSLFQYRDDAIYLRRSLKYCYYEMRIRAQGFARMNILSIKSLPYVLKPLFVGMASLFPSWAQKLRISRKTNDHRVTAEKS